MTMTFNGAGVYMSGSNIEAVNNFIHDSARSGAVVFGNKNAIRNNTITTAAFDGIWLHGSNQVAESNDISGTVANPGSCLWRNIPSWFDANGIDFEGDGQIIRGNQIHDINGSDPRNSMDPHIDGLQMPQGSSNGSIIERNDISIPRYSVRCYQSGMFSGTIKNLTVRNNVVHDMCRGFNFLATVSGLSMANNTFVNMDDYATELDGDVQNPAVHNNIHYNISHPYMRLGAVTSPDVGNNLAYQVQGSAYPGDLWGVDPKFVSLSGKDFHLQSASLARDAGLTLSIVADDKDGTPRPKGRRYDIGAFQYK